MASAVSSSGTGFIQPSSPPSSSLFDELQTLVTQMNSKTMLYEIASVFNTFLQENPDICDHISLREAPYRYFLTYDNPDHFEMPISDLCYNALYLILCGRLPVCISEPGSNNRPAEPCKPTSLPVRIVGNKGDPSLPVIVVDPGAYA